MKKYISAFICVVLAIVVILLTSCTINGTSSIIYKNADLYEVGDKTFDTEIKNIKLDWISGSVEFKYSTDSKTYVTETYNTDSVDDRLKVHTYLNGNTLYIEPSATGKIDFKNVKKTLVVELAKDTILDSYNEDNVSTNVKFSVNSLKIDIDSVSGTHTFNLDTINDLDVENVSGKFTFNLNKLVKGKIDTVSGGFTFNYLVDGNLSVSFDSVSGTLTKEIKDSSEYSLDFESTSGSLVIKKA